MSDLIKVETFIEGDKELVWECWTNPKHIINWYFATEDWHTPKAIWIGYTKLDRFLKVL